VTGPQEDLTFDTSTGGARERGGPFKRSKEEEEGGVGPPLQSVKPQQEVSKEALGLKSPVIRLQAPPHLRIRGGGMERDEGESGGRGGGREGGDSGSGGKGELFLKEWSTFSLPSPDVPSSPFEVEIHRYISKGFCFCCT